MTEKAVALRQRGVGRATTTWASSLKWSCLIELDFALPLMFVNAREKTCDPTARAKSSKGAETRTDWVRVSFLIPHFDGRISYDALLHIFDI